MKFVRWFTIFAAFLCCLSVSYPVRAAESGDTGSSNELIEGLMGILQEGIDEFIGNYKGSLGDVRLIERLGNKIVLEVTYDNVKRSDNVYVQGEVWHFGNKLEGFSNTLSSVRGSHGKAILSIGWTQEEDDGWGTVASEVESDQIRLFLVRKSNPDRPFGEILYDMSKIWTGSDAPDEEMVAMDDDDGIELEDGETGSEEKPAPSIFVKPGTVLKPYKPAGTIQAQTPARTAEPPAAQTTTPASPTLATPVLSGVRTVQAGVQQYDFYAKARSAKWRTSAGDIPFPGRTNDERGFARTLVNGTLNSGNKAVSLLQMHPEWKPKGWIDAHYPAMILGDGLHFKSVVGFLKGANQSDGAVFQVYVKSDNKYYRVARSRVESRKYSSIDADLSGYAGKKVQIVLRVRAGQNSKQDWAVWVKPRLSK